MNRNVSLLLLIVAVCLAVLLLQQPVRATGFVVNTTADTVDDDPGDGNCADINGDCSLRAAIEEANALPGSDTISFNIPTSDAGFVDATGSDCDTGDDGTPDSAPCWWQISLGSALPEVSETLTIDGATQTANQANTNDTTIGTGGTVGVSATALATWNGPEIEIDGNNALPVIKLSAADSIVEGLAFYGHTDAIHLQTSVTGLMVRHNLIGVRANGDDPTSHNQQHGMAARSEGGNTERATIEHNYIGNHKQFGLLIGRYDDHTGAALIEGNEIFNSGLESGGATYSEGIEVQSSSTGSDTYTTLRANLIRDNTASGSDVTGGNGVDISVKNVVVEENTFVANRRSGILSRDIGSNAGQFITGNIIRENGGDGLQLKFSSTNVISNNQVFSNTQSGLLVHLSSQANVIRQNTIYNNGESGLCIRGAGWNNQILTNTIHSNAGAGALLKYSSGNSSNYEGVLLSGNSFYDNTGLGIDLSTDNSDDCSSGTGLTANDVADPDNGPNRLLNFPVIKEAWVNEAEVLMVLGAVNTVNNAFFYDLEVELYETDDSLDIHGEGQRYLGVTTVDYPAGTTGYWVAAITGTHGITAGQQLTALTIDKENSTSEFAANATVQSGGFSLSGRVFEDADGHGDAYTPANDDNKSGVTVRLYYDLDGNGTLSHLDQYLTETVTTGAGYSFSDLGATDYLVVANAGEISPAAGFNGGYGQSDVWAEQVHACTHSEDVTTCTRRFGGQKAGTSDGFDPGSAAPADNEAAQHINAVTIGTVSASGVNFGFSFDPITNLGNSDQASGSNRFGQGTLRQFVNNANAIAGPNSSRFVPAISTTGTGNGGDWWQINSLGTLVFTDTATTLDGTAYNNSDGTTVLDLNPGQVGSGGTVGTGAELLSTFERPELVIFGSNADPVIRIAADQTIVSHLAFYKHTSAIQVSDGISGTQIRHNLIGLLPDGTEPPDIQFGSSCDVGLGHNCQSISIYTGKNVNTLIHHNLIGYHRSYGIKLGPRDDPAGVDPNWTGGTTFEYNEVFSNGFGIDFGDGVASHSDDNTLRYNLIRDNSSNGSDHRQDAGSGVELFRSDNTAVLSNTIRNNSRHGITIVYKSSGSLIQDNIITANGSDTAGFPPQSMPGPGILVSNQTAVIDHRISRNHIFENEGLGIDLDTTASISGTATNGDGPTDGNCDSNPMPPNRHLRRPALTEIGPAQVLVTDICPGGTIELFSADDGGEGQLYLLSLTDGDNDGQEVADLSSLAGPGELLDGGGSLVATSTDGNNNTSEFSDPLTLSIPDITVVKMATADAAKVGETITYTYQVTNTGQLTLTGVSAFDDKLGPVTLNMNQLVPDEGTTGSLTYTITSDDLPGPLTNTVVTTGSPYVGSAVTATAQFSVNLSPADQPALQIIKTANVISATVSQVITYTYWVTNTGNVTLTNLQAVDDHLGAVSLGQTQLLPDQGTVGNLTHMVTSGDLPGPLVNTVTVTGTSLSGPIVVETAQYSVTLVTPPAPETKVYLPLVIKK